MRPLSLRFVAAILGAAALTGCPQCPDDTLKEALSNVVVFKYEHVANIREIRFPEPTRIHGNSFNFVQPVDSYGFWAVFIICSLNVQGDAIKTFNYNTGNFFVEYDGETYGPLRPQQVRYGASPTGNSAADTPTVAAAIHRAVGLGPSTQPFPRGFYPSLNYRIAVLIPGKLLYYGNEQLDLKYGGQPSIVQGTGHSPAILQFWNSDVGLPGSCRGW